MRRHPASSGTTPRPIWLPIGLGSLLRLVQIWMPVLGVHSWRQADTAAMARHFSLAGTPIWMPQVDWSGASAGFVESEFPLYPFLVSRLYGLIGVQEWLGRGLSVLCSALTIWLVMRLGRRWFNPEAGWWAGLAFAIAPLGVYFGRAFQAEALLLLCAAGALESLSLWRERRLPWALALSWVCFTTAGLIKVIPLLWLGLPLLMVQLSSNPLGQAPPLQTLPGRMLRLLGRPGFWLYIGASMMAIAGWYWHAHQLGQASGLSFGFWGSGADRSSISLLLDLNGWINLLLRVSLRLLALVGVPFVLIGLRASWRSGGGQITISGLVGVLLCTIATMRSSTIHEYYQLPLLLFSSPLIGLGWQTWCQRRPRWQPRMLLGLALVVSLTVLSLDYWAGGASPARGVDAIGPHHPQGSAQRRADCECHQHRSHPAQPGPPSGLADLQQTTHAGATAALETGWSQPSGRQLRVGQDLPADAGAAATAPAGDGGSKPQAPGLTHAARPT
jgi:4-amino-4-deoxy-L-arabinose transferase-like glycosyltransferase